MCVCVHARVYALQDNPDNERRALEALGPASFRPCIQVFLTPIPYTLYPIPCTLYPVPYTLCPMPYTLCPVSCLFPRVYQGALTPIPYTLNPMPYTLYPKGAPGVLNPQRAIHTRCAKRALNHP